MGEALARDDSAMECCKNNGVNVNVNTRSSFTEMWNKQEEDEEKEE